MLVASLFLLSLLPLSLCRPSTDRGNLVVRSQRREVPTGFSPHSVSVADDELIELVLVMPQSDTSGLHAALLDVSDPSSANYGRHLSKEEIARHTEPRLESVKAVESWLSSYGITPETRSASGDTLGLRIPVRLANTLLEANYSTYFHHETKTTMLRTLSYSLPDDIHDHIAFIHPTTIFIPGVSAGITTLNININQFARIDDCNSTVTPHCLQQLYNIPITPATATNNNLYITGFGGAVSNEDDLEGFIARFRPDIEHKGLDVLTLHDSSNAGPGTAEGNFDVQYTVGLATHVPVTFMTIGNESTGIVRQDLLDLVTALLNLEEVPLVVTTSYVFNELPNDPEFEVFAHTLCNAFAQLGARGSTILFASGDGGVEGGWRTDPSRCEDGSFVPTFPSGCPFVTSVGATQGISPEIGVEFSSGGFSNIFPRPDYQNAAVEGYLQTLGDQYAGLYNFSGRAFPDVSAQGTNFLFNMSGNLSLFSGTSASSPTFASVIALINDHLLQEGKSPLGFLNPLLYSKGLSALNDVVAGNNPGCGTDGFHAVKGWDPVTGLGTPDYNRLLEVVTVSDAPHEVTKAATPKDSGQARRLPSVLKSLVAMVVLQMAYKLLVA